MGIRSKSFFGKIKKIKLTKDQEKMWQTLLFLVKLLILVIPLYLILAFNVDLSPLQEITTNQAYWMFKNMGFDVSRDGFILSVSSASGVNTNPVVFLISEDCTAWKSILLLFALIVAVAGVSMKKRLLGLAVGIPVLWLGNLARIFAIVLIAQNYGFAAANVVHDYLWQLGLISLVLLIWVAWLWFSGKIKPIKIKKSKLINPINRK
jgi:exosortase/archaeosortase family protein